MARYIKAVECAEIISEKLNIPLGDLVDIFAEIPTADVVPKSEVDSLKVELEDRVYTINSLGEYLEKSKSEVEELKAIIADCKANEERWQDLYADTVDKWEKAYEELEIKLENAKAEVAMEIFEEIEREIKNHGIAYAQRKIAELKKKYTEGEQRND